MLETVAATTTFIKCGSSGGPAATSQSPPTRSDPLLWDSHQFPDSNTKFGTVIKQEIVDNFDMTLSNQSQSDFTELKPLPFDYGSNCLTGVDPVLPNNNNNNNNSSCSKNNNNNNSKTMADLNIYIKPLSPPTPSSGRESFCFNQSPSDVTSSGSLTPPGITKIDFPADQNAFDDIASIVGISMGADSTVPTLENDLDLDAWIENTAQNIKPLVNENGIYTIQQPAGSESHSSSITDRSMTNTQPYLTHPLPLANLLSHVKLPKVTSLEQRNPPPFNLSPILQSRLTGYPQGFPGLLKVESSGYYSNEQLPHSTVPTLTDHRRIGMDGLGRAKQKPNKPRPRQIGSSCSTGGDQSKKMMHHCQICNRGFLNKSNIKVHLRTHTGEKPFGCEHCSKAFRQKAHLLKHMSIHKRISRD